MNKILETFGRDKIKELLAQCTPPQQRMFKLMYARDGGKRSVEDAEKMELNEVVDKMEASKIDNAIDQCERTVAKNASPPASPLIQQP